MGIDCVSRVGMDPNCEITEEIQWCQTKNSVLETIRDDYFGQNEMGKYVYFDEIFVNEIQCVFVSFQTRKSLLDPIIR